jgi:hypothetical protein
MRRHLAFIAFAFALFLSTGTAVLAQPDPSRPSYYGNPYNSYDRYDDDRYDDRENYRYGTPYVRPYQQPYAQPYPGPRYDQRAQRFGGLQILEAWYGRGRRVCDAAHSMRRACDGQEGCTVKAGNELCGDPTPGVVKGLSVTYRCHGQVRRAEQQEPGHIGLRC